MLLLLLAQASFLSAPSFAAGGVNIDSDSGFAIKGYDPVAYFVSEEAQKGSQEFVHEYESNRWAFANAKNKQAFIADPEAYLPQYGGHCAYAASKNSIAGIDPDAWTAHNGKLYLNYSKTVRGLWRLSRDSNIEKADGFWPELAKQVK